LVLVVVNRRREASKSLVVSKGAPRATWNSAFASLRISATTALARLPPSRCTLARYQARVRASFCSHRNTASHKYCLARLGPRLVIMTLPLCFPLLRSLRLRPKALRYALAEGKLVGSPTSAVSTAAVAFPVTGASLLAGPCAPSSSTRAL